MKELSKSLREGWHDGTFAIDLAIQGHQSLNRIHPGTLESAFAAAVNKLVGQVLNCVAESLDGSSALGDIRRRITAGRVTTRAVAGTPNW